MQKLRLKRTIYATITSAVKGLTPSHIVIIHGAPLLFAHFKENKGNDQVRSTQLFCPEELTCSACKADDHAPCTTTHRTFSGMMAS